MNKEKMHKSGKNAPNPRQVTLQLLIQWEETQEFADALLHRTLPSISSPRDRAFITELFYGTLRNLSLLDHAIQKFRSAPVEPQARWILRLGTYQLLFTRIPDHASVMESVAIAGRARPLVNAVLRKISGQKSVLQKDFSTLPLHTRFSHPKFLVERWQNTFGRDATQALLEWNNAIPSLFIRINKQKISVADFQAQNPDISPLSSYPSLFQVQQIAPDWIQKGWVYVQDSATLIPCEMLSPAPTDSILDACAAPGGKTAYLSELSDFKASILATDVSTSRLETLRENLKRLAIPNVRIQSHDWGTSAPFPETFDRILLDAPCSNSGVLRRRIDARWRISPHDFQKLPEIQLRLLQNTAKALRPGGSLVYSTCSIDPAENQEIVRQFLQQSPDFRQSTEQFSLPPASQCDGGYACLLVKK